VRRGNEGARELKGRTDVLYQRLVEGKPRRMLPDEQPAVNVETFDRAPTQDKQEESPWAR
jgi:hypothetical protein